MTILKTTAAGIAAAILTFAAPIAGSNLFGTDAAYAQSGGGGSGGGGTGGGNAGSGNQGGGSNSGSTGAGQQQQQGGSRTDDGAQTGTAGKPTDCVSGDTRPGCAGR